MAGFLAVIPARAGSTRLPDKPLLDVAGLPLVVRTASQVARSGARQVLVATDDDRIASVVAAHGHDVMLTRADHATGTDRLAEVAERLSLDDDAIVVNVQGDEPLIEPALIDRVAERLAATPWAAIATAAVPITDTAQLFSPSAVKVVCAADGRALYFSRAPIPWARDALADGQQRIAPGLPALLHIGLYAYRAGFLRRYTTLPAGTLERYESLEQLRALEHGHAIVVGQEAAAPAPGVDTPEDLARVRAVFSGQPAA